MDSRPNSSFRPYLTSAITMFVLGWGGLALVVTQTLPTVWPRWGFFVLWTLALTGTALPVAWFLNLRFPSEPPAGAAVVMRQAIWVGVYGATLAWLQLGRIASLWVVIILAAGLIAIEYLIRMRERSRWTPPPVETESSEPNA